jgi:hypothetical protein
VLPDVAARVSERTFRFARPVAASVSEWRLPLVLPDVAVRISGRNFRFVCPMAASVSEWHGPFVHSLTLAATLEKRFGSPPALGAATAPANEA